MTEENTVTASSGDVFKDLGLGTVEEFTRKRLDFVNNRLNEIEQERNSLIDERIKLIRTAKNIGIIPRTKYTNKATKDFMLVRDHIIDVLKDRPLNAANILIELAKKGIHFKAKNTVRSHLNILKQANRVTNNDGIWSLVSENRT